MKSMREIDIDPEALKICEECGTPMIRISLPSELPKWECLSCGCVEWITEPVWSHTGGPYETVTVRLDEEVTE